MKVLVTGFDPFGGETVNPAYEAVRNLPEEIAGAKIITMEIPTVFKKSAGVVEQAIIQNMPDIVINVGQAGGRTAVSIEKVAINLAEASIPDNDGDMPIDEALIENGPTAYFATIPVKAMVHHVKEHGIPCSLSYTAGTYVCNSIMYHMLHLTATKYPNIKAGFIHVPYAPQQTTEKPQYASMSIEDITKALTYAIEAAVLYESDRKENMGITH